MKTRSSNYKKERVIFIGAFVLWCICACADVIPSDYRYIDLRYDDVYVEKQGRILIGSTIVDFDVDIGPHGKYMIGLRIPVKFMQCRRTHSSVGIFVTSEIWLTEFDEYFVLDFDTTEVLFYRDIEKFKEKIDELLVSSELDFSSFKSIREKGQKLGGDLEEPLECNEYPPGTRAYQNPYIKSGEQQQTGRCLSWLNLEFKSYV